MAPPPEEGGGGARWLRREVLLRQFVSLLITSTGFSSSELARQGINAPTSQSLLNCLRRYTHLPEATAHVLPFLGFALAMFLFYSTVPTVLKICGATMLNSSLLISDMWSVLIRIFAYHEKVDWIYFVAFAGTAAGLVIYSYKSKEAEETAQVAGASDEQGKEGDEEAGCRTRRGTPMSAMADRSQARSCHQMSAPPGNRQ